MKHAVQAVIEAELRKAQRGVREVEKELEERKATDSEPGSSESIEAARNVDVAEKELERQQLHLDGLKTMADAVLMEMGVPVPGPEKKATRREDF